MNRYLNDKKLKIIVSILLFIFIAVLIIKFCPIKLQNDNLYDLKLGERYWNGGIFKIDNYSIHSGLIYQTHHYLVCLILYFFFSIFSLKGLYYLEIILFGIIAFLLYKLNREIIKNKFIQYIFLIFELIALVPFVSVRAQMFSYILFLIEILCIEKFIKTNKWFYAIFLTISPLLLINLHSGVIYFYFIVLLTYGLNYFKINIGRITYDNNFKIKIKIFISIIIGGILLTFINPYGVNGLTYAFKTLNNYEISHYIEEFQSPKWVSPLGILIIIYILIFVFSLIKSNRKIKIHELLLFGGTLFMTMTSVRHFSLLVITSVVLLPHVEDAIKQLGAGDWDLMKSLKKGLTVMNVILVVFYVGLLCRLIVSDDKRHDQLPKDSYPVDAVKYIIKNIGTKARIFNMYDWGSYLMYNNILVFIDSRCDLYTKKYNSTNVFQDYTLVMSNRESYKDIVGKYNLEYLLLDVKAPLTRKIIRNKSYKIIYQDKTAIIIKINK